MILGDIWNYGLIAIAILSVLFIGRGVYKVLKERRGK